MKDNEEFPIQLAMYFDIEKNGTVVMTPKEPKTNHSTTTATHLPLPAEEFYLKQSNSAKLNRSFRQPGTFNSNTVTVFCNGKKLHKSVRNPFL